jgi:hypothetical protein
MNIYDFSWFFAINSHEATAETPRLSKHQHCLIVQALKRTDVISLLIPTGQACNYRCLSSVWKWLPTEP